MLCLPPPYGGQHVLPLANDGKDLSAGLKKRGVSRIFSCRKLIIVSKVVLFIKYFYLIMYISSFVPNPHTFIAFGSEHEVNF
jgi:hypothetical protein